MVRLEQAIVDNARLVIMATTLFFYDLETSGFDPKEARIMQFAGQRTDKQLKPLGKPYSFYIRLTEDVLPDPGAILITGITPQKTIAEGLREPEFLSIFQTEIALAGTIFTGFNTVRFDDEFMRYLHYRNFYDPYEWHWKDGRSRWDLLDTVRMTRALRPEGIKWPLDAAGSPTNRLAMLTAANKLKHSMVHDALSDVKASLALARLIRAHQPKLFDFLLSMRDKEKVSALVRGGKPFVYTSGQYASEWEKTTIVGVLAEQPDRQGVLVFDLRYDPRPLAAMKPAELAAIWHRRKDESSERLPVKVLKFNRCPAVAPLTVLDKQSQQRLNLNLNTAMKNYRNLRESGLDTGVLKALELLEKRQPSRHLAENDAEADARLYDGFFSRQDRAKMSIVRSADADELKHLDIRFDDQRLQTLLPLYKARHFPTALSNNEHLTWERFKQRKFLGGQANSRLSRYFARIEELARQPELSAKQRYWLEELKLYGQNVQPADL